MIRLVETTRFGSRDADRASRPLTGNASFIFATAIETGVGTTRDVIRDFEDFGDNDTIDLSGFAGALIFSAGSVFSGVANEVIAKQSGADVLLLINTGGTTAAEAEILLANSSL